MKISTCAFYLLDTRLELRYIPLGALLEQGQSKTRACARAENPTASSTVRSLELSSTSHMMSPFTTSHEMLLALLRVRLRHQHLVTTP